MTELNSAIAHAQTVNLTALSSILVRGGSIVKSSGVLKYRSKCSSNCELRSAAVRDEAEFRRDPCVENRWLCDQLSIP